ncbi:GNAT family N-acetyltransferase [Paenibacillus sp. LHD-117]|uniref:GNAT family N-acetyltransferase n=1 Tax=Paenibacillus sp. LHD-117 TaxID=3071412 RepID=UPI0027E07350|nr:GNAT family N-acetyltransferase [Paenibacillus sp. LHD-117]MDQ6419543.1 GNAT family N-acetyltransferase [Paenibacillus sp. LHD-117]
MIQRIEHRNMADAEAILAVQLPSYRVEAELIGFDGIPALKDTPESVMASEEEFVGFYEEGQLAGVISYAAEADEIDICRLVVHPDRFRRGIATKLLEHVLRHCAAGKRAVVSTGAANEPAIALYKRYGFEEYGQLEVAPGFFITQLARDAK